jgi:hypothetical protein
MERHMYVVVFDYSDDSSDFSDADTDAHDTDDSDTEDA